MRLNGSESCLMMAMRGSVTRRWPHRAGPSGPRTMVRLALSRTRWVVNARRLRARTPAPPSPEVDRGLHGLPRPDVVDVPAAVAGERGVAVAAARWARVTLVEELAQAVAVQAAIVGAVDHGAEQDRRAAVAAAGEVGLDALRAAREEAADADHQRGAPGVRAVRRHRRTGCIRAADGAVAQVAIGLAVQRVVALGPTPEVVVAVERPRAGSPTRSRPAAAGSLSCSRTTPCRARRARAGPPARASREHVRERSPRDEHERRRICRRVRELDELARVAPASLEIHRAADAGQRRPLDHVVVRPVIARVGVEEPRAVVQVRRLALQRTGDHIGAVALCLEERDGVGDARCEQLGARGDAERGRRRADARHAGGCGSCRERGRH